MIIFLGHSVVCAHTMSCIAANRVNNINTSVKWNQFQFNSIQIYFPSKQQTHLKNTQDGGDATKSKSLKDAAPPLQLKTQQQKSKHKTKASKASNKHVHGIIHHWKLNYIWWFVLTIWKVTNFPLRKCNWGYSWVKIWYNFSLKLT